MDKKRTQDKVNERKKFERDSNRYGYNLQRSRCLCPNPVCEYLDPLTGHRWAGWLAALNIEP